MDPSAVSGGTPQAGPGGSEDRNTLERPRQPLVTSIQLLVPRALTASFSGCDSTDLVQSPSAPSSDSALRLAVDLRRLPWMRRLALDYAFDYDAVSPFFAGDPRQRDAWIDTFARVRGHSRPHAAIAAMIAAQQEHRDAPAPARASAARLADPSTVAIVTGQQAGLFGGPLYTLLKAITAIRLTSRISREHDMPVVPVFWIDAEDHDWDEVAGCGVLDANQEWRDIRVPTPDGAGERPVASLAYTGEIEAAIHALEQTLPATEFTPELVGALRRDYVPGRSVPDAFGRWMERALGPLGLVVFDSSDPAAKPFAAPLFRGEIAHPGRTARLAAEAGAQLTSRGYHAQVTANEASVALFDIESGRKPIKLAGEAFQIGDEVVSTSALLERASSHPQSFSPNVLLRPLVQDTIFPTVCYVAGPNELAYHAQLRRVYESFSVPMPLVQPRATATILDSAGVRFLTRYKVPFEDLEAQDERALNALLRAQLPTSVEKALEEADAEIAARLEAVIRAVPVIDPTLEGAARSTLGKIEHDLRALRGKILQAAKRRDDTLRRQFMHVRSQAFPGGAPQERNVGFVVFLNKYGPALVERLASELPLDSGTHWIVTV
jgi:bacillithiol biosynthesis cysteine-adding enzyme BshC